MLAELENEESASDQSLEAPRSCSVPGLGFKLAQDYYSDEEELVVDSIGDCDSGEEDDTDSLFEEGFEMRRATRKRQRKVPNSSTQATATESSTANPKKDELEGKWTFKP